jgi:hypothetical protein
VANELDVFAVYNMLDHLCFIHDQTAVEDLGLFLPAKEYHGIDSR